MNPLFDRLGVDRAQWSALTKAFLRIDFPNLSGGKPVSRVRAGISLTALAFIVYGFAGIVPAIIAAKSPDPLLAGTALAATVAFMVAATLMMGEGMSLVSPNDHAIIGHRPVTSRTYMAVRVTALLIRTFVVAGIIPALTVVVMLFKGRVVLAVAAFVCGELAGVAATFGVVAMYGWVLRVAGPTRTARLVGYMQMAASFLAWGSFILVNRDITGRAIAGVSLSATWWWILLPPSWFGSLMLLGSGAVTATAVLALVFGLASIGVLAWFIRDKLSMDYTAQLADLASATTAVAPPRREWLGALNAETRAVAILVRSQIEHDMKFRLALLSLVPVTFIYMFAGGWPSDPFLHVRGGNPGMIQMALLFIPMSLRQTIVSSENYRASWIFHATPADRARLVLSARNVITGFFLLPYLAVLAALFAYAFKDSSHALIHAGFMGLLSWMVLQFIIMMSPELPFSLPHGKDANAGLMFVRMIFSMLIGLGSYYVLVALVYGHTMRMIGAALIFILLGLLMDWGTRQRVNNRRVEAMIAE